MSGEYDMQKSNQYELVIYTALVFILLHMTYSRICAYRKRNKCKPRLTRYIRADIQQPFNKNFHCEVQRVDGEKDYNSMYEVEGEKVMRVVQSDQKDYVKSKWQVDCSHREDYNSGTELPNKFFLSPPDYTQDGQMMPSKMAKNVEMS